MQHDPIGEAQTQDLRNETAAQAGLTQLEVRPVPSPERARRTRRGLRVLFFVALSAFLGVYTAPMVLDRLQPSPQVLLHTQASVPDPVAPTGVLAEVYKASRPATLRVEARCATGSRSGPLGVGTGFYVSEDGDVLTAYHVVESDDGGFCPIRYVGVEADGDEVTLEMIGFDAYFDIAWMRAKGADNPPFLPLVETSPRPGDEVVAIGNSRGDNLAPRAGRVLRLGVEASRADFADDTIELTAALAPGDSGGPVLNEAGEVLGVVSYISFAPDAGTGGYVPPFLRGLDVPGGFASYAVPVSQESEIITAIQRGDQRDVPVIGFSWRPGFDYDPDEGDALFGRRPGPIVVEVAPGGPADRSGLLSYSERAVYGANGEVVDVERLADVIVAVDGEATPTFYDLLEAIRRKQVGETVSLTVQRGRTTVRLELELGAKRDVF